MNTDRIFRTPIACVVEEGKIQLKAIEPVPYPALPGTVPRVPMSIIATISDNQKGSYDNFPPEQAQMIARRIERLWNEARDELEPLFRALLCEIEDAFGEAVETDTAINGADAVDWVTEFLPRVSQALGRSRQGPEIDMFLPEIDMFLSVSTAHLRPDEREQVDIGEMPSVCRSFVSMTGEYGALIYVPEVESPEDEAAVKAGLSEGFQGVVEAAIRRGLRYIKLDADAPPLEGVPVYDDESVMS